MSKQWLKLKASSESATAAVIREAIGAGPDEEIDVTTPQFDRASDMSRPKSPPSDWKSLRLRKSSELRAMGCGAWANRRSDKTSLMLFPAEWYEAIPSGFEVETISGRTEFFVPGETDNDRRFGCLAYGVRVEHDGAFSADDD